MIFKNGRSSYSCNEECEVCEGEAYIITGQYSAFNSKRMELIDFDVKKPCPNSQRVYEDDLT